MAKKNNYKKNYNRNKNGSSGYYSKNKNNKNINSVKEENKEIIKEEIEEVVETEEVEEIKDIEIIDNKDLVEEKKDKKELIEVVEVSKPDYVKMFTDKSMKPTKAINSKIIKSNKNKIKYGMSIISFLLLMVLYISIINLNILPLKYNLLILGLFVFIDTIANVCLFVKKLWTKIISAFMYIIIILISVVGSYYVYNTNEFFNNSFNNAEDTYKLTYYVLSKNKYTKNDLNNLTITYYESTVHIEEALKEYSKKYKSNMVSSISLEEVLASDVLLIESSTFKLQSEIEENKININDYNLIYEFTLEFKLELDTDVDEETTTEVGETTTTQYVKDPNVINIFVGGYDFSNVRMDFNALITLNMETHKLLITNIPRDYYLYIPGKGVKDTLSTMSPYGVTNNVRAVEKLLDVKIDYYLTAKTPSLVALVDNIGGITYCSDKAYTTDHALVLGTYDDTKGPHLQVKKGCQHLNGIETLTVARERNNYAEQDIARNRNNAKIMKAILAQMKTPAIATNYTKVLNSVSNMYTTTMPKEVVQEGVKSLLTTDWQVKNQVLTGVTDWGICQLSGTRKYVMTPTGWVVNNAKAEIRKI